MRRSKRPPLLRTLAVLTLGGVLVGLLGTAAGAPPHGTGSAPAAAVPSPPDFAARAGYQAGLSSQLTGSRTPSGLLPVDVVFEPAATGAGTRAGLLTASAYAAEYGPSPSAYAGAAQYFRSEGLVVTHEWPDRLTISLEGNATAVDRAFGTSLVAGAYDGRPVMLPSTAPSLPASIEADVAGVVGLSTGFETFSISLAPVPSAGADSVKPSQGSGNTVYPGIAREYYGLSAFYNLTGSPVYPTNQSIALILWGQGYSPSDIQTFFEDDYGAGFPAAHVVPYPVDGAPYPDDSAPGSADRSDVEEMTLDIEWSGSAAPGATLDAVYAPNGSAPSYSPSTADLTDAFETALSLSNVSVISMSFGVGEAGDQSLRSAWTPLLGEAASRGITVLAASGDFGGDADPSCSGGTSVEYPSSSPEVLAVGGTDVTLSRSPLGQVTGFNETAWNGSGGGYSAQFSAPSWQEVGSAAGPIESNGSHRGVPDVAASAGDDFLYFDGADMQAAGTSFATPFWAGLVAEMDQQYGKPLGWILPQIYHVGASQPSGQIGIGLVPIDGGGNCVATATGGWSAVTGWGSPRAILLYEDLVGSYVNLSLAVAPTTVAPGGSVSVDTQLTNRTTGIPIADTTVRIEAVADTTIGPCTGTFSSAAPETNATGWVQAQLSVPFCYLGSHANVTVIVTTDRLYGTNQTTIAVNLLGLFPALEAIEQAPWSYVSYVSIMAVAVVSGALLGRRSPRLPPPGPSRPARAGTRGPTGGPGTPVVVPAAPAPPAPPGAPPANVPAAPTRPPPPPPPAPTGAEGVRSAVPSGAPASRPAPIPVPANEIPYAPRAAGVVEVPRVTPLPSRPMPGRPARPLRSSYRPDFPVTRGPSAGGPPPAPGAPASTGRTGALPPLAKLPSPSHGERRTIRAASAGAGPPSAPTAGPVPSGASLTPSPAAGPTTPPAHRRPPPENTQNP